MEATADQKLYALLTNVQIHCNFKILVNILFEKETWIFKAAKKLIIDSEMLNKIDKKNLKLIFKIFFFLKY